MTAGVSLPDGFRLGNIFGKGAAFFDTQNDLIEALKQELKGDEAILIKGSRAQRMENVVAALVENFRSSATAPASPKAPTVGALPPASMQSDSGPNHRDVVNADIAGALSDLPTSM